MMPVRPMPRVAAVLLLLGSALPVDARAQALLDRSLRAGPQVVSYRFDTPDEKRITQLAVPVAVAMRVGRRLSVDLATAYASVRYDSASFAGAINGLTDTQLRASYTFGADNVVVTTGVNLPTGQSTVHLATQGAAAGQIGNDFLAFPISNMGTGLAGTGGIAVARAIGAWNVGSGVSFRRTVEYEPFDSVPGVGRVRFQPGDEYRVRLGADRSLGRGQLTAGLTYYAFGADADGRTTYSSGDRILAQGGWVTPVRGASVALSAWNLYRRAGAPAGAAGSPPENIANIALATGFTIGRTVLEPNIELRGWTRDGEPAGRLGLWGVRGRVDAGRVALIPSIAWATGSVDASASARTGLTGWRGLFTAQLR